MTAISHHPDDALLLAHAAGQDGAAISVIVATHLAFCGRCRAEVMLAERIGGALLDTMAPVALAPDALARTLARLDDAPAPVLGAGVAADGTPAPLRAFIGRDLSALRWRHMGPRLAYVPLYRRGGVSIRLLRGAPGADTGRHSHRGMEYTLVLRGGFTDETGRYGPGDFQTASSDVRHNPVADDDGDCINLAVTTAPLRFDGLVQKVAGKLFGF